MQATPATWAMLIEAGWRATRELRVLCGGEAIPPALADGLLMRAKEVWNVYGPTETTIWSSSDAHLDEAEPITIGRPIANTQFYVVDGPGNPFRSACQASCASGERAGAGYFHRPELTAEKFIANPFSREPGGATLQDRGPGSRSCPAAPSSIWDAWITR